MAWFGEAWNAVKEAEAVYTTVTDLVDAVVGTPQKRKREEPVSENPLDTVTRGGTRFRRRFDVAKLPSQPNFPSDSNMSTSKRTQAMGHDEEVAVVPPPKRIAKAYADYTTIKLPWFDRTALSTVATSSALATHVFRLNSVYDPDYTAAGITHQPLGRDKFAAFGYKYYRVLSCDVTLEFHNGTSIDTSAAIDQFVMVGYELTDDPSTAFDDYRAFVEGKQTKGQILKSTVQANGGLGLSTRMTYHYNPSSWDFHVQETGIEERWTPIGEDPPNPHYLVLHSGMAVLDGNYTTRTNCYVHLSYTVQFREASHPKAVDDS